MATLSLFVHMCEGVYVCTSVTGGSALGAFYRQRVVMLVLITHTNNYMACLTHSHTQAYNSHPLVPEPRPRVASALDPLTPSQVHKTQLRHAPLVLLLLCLVLLLLHVALLCLCLLQLCEGAAANVGRQI